ncbi:MAG: cation:proton antiporter subunit C [Gammaproteobacteria bacterium]
MRFLQLYNYEIAILLSMIGFYVLVSRGNLVMKVAGLSMFQTSVFILYISMGVVQGGTVPILVGGTQIYSNPLPHVLILTAIVVGVATTAVALALIIRIKEAYGTVEEDEIHEQDRSF